MNSPFNDTITNGNNDTTPIELPEEIIPSVKKLITDKEFIQFVELQVQQENSDTIVGQAPDGQAVGQENSDTIDEQAPDGQEIGQENSDTIDEQAPDGQEIGQENSETTDGQAIGQAISDRPQLKEEESTQLKEEESPQLKEEESPQLKEEESPRSKQEISEQDISEPPKKKLKLKNEKPYEFKEKIAAVAFSYDRNPFNGANVFTLATFEKAIIKEHCSKNWMEKLKYFIETLKVTHLFVRGYRQAEVLKKELNVKISTIPPRRDDLPIRCSECKKFSCCISKVKRFFVAHYNYYLPIDCY